MNKYLMGKRKAQIWFTDFVVGSMIFTFMLIGYYAYTTNILNQGTLVVKDLISDSDLISSSLLLPGSPNDWDISTVQSIGITNNNQEVNRTKFLNFDRISYNSSKKYFGTIYDYAIFFTDENETASNVEGICGFGPSEVKFTYNIKAAYYHSDETLLKDFMENELGADVFSKTAGNIGTLINDFNDYSLVVFEHPVMTMTNYNEYRDDFDNFVSNGGFLVLSGEVFDVNDKEMAGVKFYEELTASSNQNASVVEEDEFLTFKQDKNITFAQAYYIVNNSIETENFTRIAEFIDGSIEEDNNAIARWKFGSGNVFYFGDFDAEYSEEDYLDIVKKSLLKWANVNCIINTDNIVYKNLIKIERLMIYGSKPIKMVFYLWQ